TWLIAGILAWLAMMFEAIAWSGLDNLVLPLVSYLLLRIYLDFSVADLSARLGITACLTLFLFLYRHRTTLVGSAVFGAFLAGYITWALGGWQSLLPPLLLFLTYGVLSPRTAYNRRHIPDIPQVIAVVPACVTCFFL